MRSPPLRSGFWASPTRDGSLVAFSLVKVLHSEPTSITRSPGEDEEHTLHPMLEFCSHIYIIKEVKSISDTAGKILTNPKP